MRQAHGPVRGMRFGLHGVCRESLDAVEGGVYTATNSNANTHYEAQCALVMNFNTTLPISIGSFESREPQSLDKSELSYCLPQQAHSLSSGCHQAILGARTLLVSKYT